MDSTIAIEKTFETVGSIEQRVEKVFDEFQELLIKNKEKHRFSRNEQKQNLQIINSYHAFCQRCNDHIYLSSDLRDTNSFFQSHINTSYHKSSNIINRSLQNEPTLQWEEFGLTGCCKVCEISGLYATVFETKHNSIKSSKIHMCKENHENNFYGVYSKKEILLKFFSLQLFYDKFIKTSDNCSFCLLCQIKIKDSTKTKHHLIGDLHYENFLSFIKFQFNFTCFDLLNGFNMEEIIKWTLQQNLPFNIKKFKIYDEEKFCIEKSNTVSNCYGRDIFFCYIPKHIQKLLELNTCDLIINESCLLCQKKNVTQNHFNSKTHGTKSIKEILKNKEIYQMYLRNCEERLMPHKEEIEFYKNYMKFLKSFKTFNTQKASNVKNSCDEMQKNTLDVTKASKKKNTKNNVQVLCSCDNKFEKKNVLKNDNSRNSATENIKIISNENSKSDVSNNSVPCEISNDSFDFKHFGETMDKISVLCKENKTDSTMQNLSNSPQAVSNNNDNNTKSNFNGNSKHNSVRKNNSKSSNNGVSFLPENMVTDCVKIIERETIADTPQDIIIKENTVKIAEKLNSSQKINKLHLIGKRRLKQHIIVKMKKESGEIENFLMVSALPKKVKWSKVYAELLNFGEIKHVFFKEKRRFVFFENSKTISAIVDKQPIVINNKIVPITFFFKEEAQKILEKYAMYKEHRGNKLRNKSVPENVTSNEFNDKIVADYEAAEEDSVKKGRKVSSNKSDDLSHITEKYKFGKILFSDMITEMPIESFLMISNLPKAIKLWEVYDELLKYGEIANIFFKGNKNFVFFEDPGTSAIVAGCHPILVRNTTIPLTFIPQEEAKQTLKKYGRLKQINLLNLKLSSLLTAPYNLLFFTCTLLSKSSKIISCQKERDRESIVCSKVLSVAKKKYETNHIFPFGSRLSGLASDDSDLDILIDCGNMYVQGDSWNNAFQKRIAYYFAGEFKKMADFSNVVCVANARVPIVRFLEKESNLRCDLSFKNGLSVENTKLLKFLFSLDSRLQLLILFLKFWLKSYNLHGPQSFSSYAMSLMVIFYVQQLPIPILPEIEILKKSFRGRRLTIEGWDCNFNTDSHLLKPVKNKDTFLKLLLGFFEFYSEFDFNKFFVSPLTGTPIPRESFNQSILLPMAYKRHFHNISAKQTYNKNAVIGVIDPFDLSHNVASNFSAGRLKYFVNRCKLSFELLTKSLNEQPI